ncbi:MAG: tetraacyldisaccharide 4'-kinase [Alphaproteobacteria bacterium]|nr:tetraacyldisaccharide 4'-kinase [Alphaproteobacteria bacterium]
MRAPEFWTSGRGPGPVLLAPAARLVAAFGRERRRLARPWRAPVPVVCVGNVVVGGAGKTPIALAIVAALRLAGINAHCLTRGYGGQERGPVAVDLARHDAAGVGDEALLLARAGPTWVARDRRRAAEAATAAGAEILLLDDGLQNLALVHDLALFVIDGGYGFGNGLVLPAGPLREPVEAALERCHAVVLVGRDTCGVQPAIGRRRPLFRARLEAGPEAARLAGERVFAFAGIGRPEKFFATVEEVGAVMVGAKTFPDHHPYAPEEIMAICEAADRANALPLTTAKDHVRLPASARAMIRVLDVHIAWDDPSTLDRLLQPLVRRVMDRRG